VVDRPLEGTPMSLAPTCPARGSLAVQPWPPRLTQVSGFGEDRVVQYVESLDR
jgi:hypothetical protein